MTKIIHCIKVGPNPELGDFELSCIDSWKKVYPDFEIKYWTDEQILPLIQDCKYATSSYGKKVYIYALDYARLKILYEFGGLYLGTDTFCVDRLPDSCFNTAFTCWDPGLDTYWSQNKICLYCEKGNKIIKEMVDMYLGFQPFPEFEVDNTVVESVLRTHGLNFNDRLRCRYDNQVVDNCFAVYNCVQLGAWDYIQKCYNYSPDYSVFFVNCEMRPYYKRENVQLFYAFLNDDTDLNKLSSAINAYINMKIPEGVNPVLAIGVNCINGNEGFFSKRLWTKLGGYNQKQWDIFPIGKGLDEDQLNEAFLDYVSKRYNKIKFCRNIMEGNFTGDLNGEVNG